MFVAKSIECSTQEIIICVVVITQAIPPWKSKYYQTVAYGKICTSEIDIQHVKLEFCQVHYFLV